MRDGVVIEDITDQGEKNLVTETCSSCAPNNLSKEQVAQQTEHSQEHQNLENIASVDNEARESDQARRGLQAAEAFKREGNALYSSGDYQAALEKYAEALEVAPDAAPERAVYLGNRAACLVKLEQYGEAAHECSAALDINPNYSKVLLRRSNAYECLDDLERALADAVKALELEPENKVASSVVGRLEPIVHERREKLKEEMLGKLKELGNTVLGKFGMSLDNFKAEKDPSSGSYSIKYQQS